ncbi:MAG: M4 family metallopeptidase, partial [Candidatus Obscuribacterales bacterium]|nr:M4 family metallopeptidase [Candidatus Obscuribacterales bacterium]
KLSLTDDAARQAGQNLFAQLDSNRAESSALSASISSRMKNVKPDGYSAIPPYLLNEIANRTGNGAFSSAAKEANDMQSNGSTFRPSANGGGNGAREVYDAKGKEVQPGDKARFEGEKATGNSEVDKAYDFTGIVRDFYQKEYGRNSIDGNGMKFVSTVNYGDNYENAFWNGSQMTYGHAGPDSPFKTFMLLDVAGHEITHGVTEKEANETYYGQSGALNESNSDIFGELIKQYSKHQTADQADWLVGDGIWKDGIKGRALRDMLHPGTAYDDPKLGKDPQPADMAHYSKTWQDNGGVHINSGIPNRAFALFAKSVGGYAWDDPGHIWFAARKAAGSDPSFAQFAYQTIEAAKALGHADEVGKLQKAWATVGVTPSATAIDTDTPTNSGDEELAAKQLKKAS